jgi:hypothetical protein
MSVPLDVWVGWLEAAERCDEADDCTTGVLA